MPDTNLHPTVTLRLYTDHKCFGPGAAMLLRRGRAFRSLRQLFPAFGWRIVNFY